MKNTSNRYWQRDKRAGMVTMHEADGTQVARVMNVGHDAGDRSFFEVSGPGFVKTMSTTEKNAMTFAELRMMFA